MINCRHQQYGGRALTESWCNQAYPKEYIRNSTNNNIYILHSCLKVNQIRRNGEEKDLNINPSTL